MRNAIAIVAALGVGVMGYLTELHLSGGGQAACDLGEGVSCSAVSHSAYATLLGIPVSILGIVYFLGVIGLLFWKKAEKVRYGAIAAITVFSLVFGAYLTLIELTVIGSICLFCEVSKVLMLAVLALALIQLKKQRQAVPKQWLVAAVIVGLLFSGLAYLTQRETGPTKDYTHLAECLVEQGVEMYGSYTCPSCAKQRRSFGEAFEVLGEVECHPRGPNSQVERCLEKNITKTPTWIQEVDGEETKRLTGAKDPEELAAEFGCPIE